MAHINPETRMSCQNMNVRSKQQEGWSFTCNLCEEIGYDNAYECSGSCGFIVHQECHTATSPIHHEFYDHSSFNFQRELPSFMANSNTLCDGCGLRVTGASYVYMNKRNNDTVIKVLHPCCINLPSCIETDEESAILIEKLSEDQKCQHCEETTVGQEIMGWAYVSDHDYACHVKCMRWILYDGYQSRMNQEENNNNNSINRSISSSSNTNTLATGYSKSDSDNSIGSYESGTSHGGMSVARPQSLKSDQMQIVKKRDKVFRLLRSDTRPPLRKRDKLWIFARAAFLVAQLLLVSLPMF